MCGILCQAVQTVAACIRAGGVSSFKLGEVIRLSRCFCGLHFCSKVWVAGGDDRNRFGVGFGVGYRFCLVWCSLAFEFHIALLASNKAV